MRVQDLMDREGDYARGGKTVPLVLGDDGPLRWTVAIPVSVWSCVCHTLWSLHVFSVAISITFGLVVAGRAIFTRGVLVDRFTWKLWSLWLRFLYLLPVLKNQGFISGFLVVGTV